MKNLEVEIGGTHLVKVSGRLCFVRVDSESVHGGSNATNLETGQYIWIRTARRLRRKVQCVMTR